MNSIAFMQEPPCRMDPYTDHPPSELPVKLIYMDMSPTPTHTGTSYTHIDTHILVMY